MSKVRGTSNVPMVLGIIGGVLGLPAAVCSGACAAGITAAVNNAADSASTAAGNTFMTLGLIGAVIGIIFAIMAKKSPVISGLGLVVATILSAITLITFNFLTLSVVILFLLATVFAFVQKKEVVQ